MNQNYHTTFEDLLVKYLLREAGPEETRTVEQWLAADPANRQYYDQIQLIWEKSQRLTARGSLPEIEGEEEQAWQVLRQKMRKPARRTPVHTLRWAASVAAAAVLLFCLFRWPHPAAISWQTTASTDHIRIDTLADGSIITLNKHSSLSRPSAFNTKDRTVSLAGEAFFRIAPDKDRPFHVQTNGIGITVLGTSFNVRTENDKTIISVESGLIEVKNRQNSIHVAAGETITLDKNDAALQTRPAGTSLYKYYQPRDFVCHDTPLGDLVDALNSSYGDSIVITDPTIRKLPITTTFRSEPLTNILQVIGATLNIRVQRTGATYALDKK